MGRLGHRVAIAAVTVSLLLAACNSTGGPQAIDTPASLDPNPASSQPGAKPGKRAPGSPTSPGTVSPGGENPVAGEPSAPPVKPVKGIKPANLFTPEEDRIGITDDTITLCIHAALNLAPVFNISERSLNVYWEYVNAELGGIYGRRVQITYTDDKYGATPSDVRAAYEGCKARNPFLLLGGIGFDQIPQVRTWAEQDHIPYIHHIAREDLSKKYSFSYLPTVETVGKRAAQWILHAHRGERIGVIWRNSEHWEPGHRSFKAQLATKNVRAVADVPAEKNATVYTNQIRALQNADAEVVFIWENALAAIEIIRQAHDQNYKPTWVVFPFNLMSDHLGADTVNPAPIEGISTWAAYMPGVQDPVSKQYQPGKVDGAFARYKHLIKEFERQHNLFAAGENRDDIVAMTWVGWSQIHKLLLQCGRDCTRNKLVGLLQSGKHTVEAPACPIDFTRNGHIASDTVMVLKAFRNPDNGKYGWKEVERCKASF